MTLICFPPSRPLRHGSLAVLIAAMAGGPTAPAFATDAPAISVELNKLEPQAKSCRAYVVIDNPSETAYQALKLDLVFFQSDGTIGRRLAFDIAPLRPAKKSVKTFDLEGMACDTIGSLLVNDVLECRDATGAVPDCLDRLKFSSRASAPLGK